MKHNIMHDDNCFFFAFPKWSGIFSVTESLIYDQLSMYMWYFWANKVIGVTLDVVRNVIYVTYSRSFIFSPSLLS